MAVSYQQPVKARVRRQALTTAVESLTTLRDWNCAVRPTYVREVRDQLLRAGGLDAEKAVLLDDSTVRRWEDLHRSLVGVRRAQDLQVCYLAGPEPMNDFEVLVDLGVHPNNIWAFESDPKQYRSAVEAVRDSPFRTLKLHKGKLETFFEQVPKQFDIVYFDACGPLTGRQKILRALSTMFRAFRLRSPGVLVLNVALPDLENPVEARLARTLVASYLYPKSFLEPVEPNDTNLAEGATAHGHCLDSFHGEVVRNFSHYYGQFVTRLLLDLALVVVPTMRIEKDWKEFFAAPPPKVLASLDSDHFVDDPSNWPIAAALHSLVGGPLSQGALLPTGVDQVDRRIGSWVEEIEGLPTGRGAWIDAITAMEVVRTGHVGVLSEGMLGALRAISRAALFQFCDVPTFTLALDPLVHQMSFPHHAQPARIARWSYTAKETEMFTDVITFDTCRYLYEWLPTRDLLDEGLFDRASELAYRFALDGVSKTRRWTNPDILMGTAVLDQDLPGFAAAPLPRRIRLSDDSL